MLTFPKWLKLVSAVCMLLLGLGVLNLLVWRQMLIGLTPKQTAILPLFPCVVVGSLIMNHPAYRRLVHKTREEKAGQDRTEI